MLRHNLPAIETKTPQKCVLTGWTNKNVCIQTTNSLPLPTPSKKEFLSLTRAKFVQMQSTVTQTSTTEFSQPAAQVRHGQPPGWHDGCMGVNIKCMRDPVIDRTWLGPGQKLYLLRKTATDCTKEQYGRMVAGEHMTALCFKALQPYQFLFSPIPIAIFLWVIFALTWLKGDGSSLQHRFFEDAEFGAQVLIWAGILHVLCSFIGVSLWQTPQRKLWVHHLHHALALSVFAQFGWGFGGKQDAILENCTKIMAATCIVEEVAALVFFYYGRRCTASCSFYLVAREIGTLSFAVGFLGHLWRSHPLTWHSLPLVLPGYTIARVSTRPNFTLSARLRLGISVMVLMGYIGFCPVQRLNLLELLANCILQVVLLQYFDGSKSVFALDSDFAPLLTFLNNVARWTLFVWLWGL